MLQEIYEKRIGKPNLNSIYLLYYLALLFLIEDWPEFIRSIIDTIELH